jgi:lipopolysaccharide transport system ATP-binding protein
MSDTAIRVENLSKLYRVGEIGTGTISHDLNRWWSRFRGKEDPYSKIGESNDRTQVGDSNYVWALQDIDFEVKQGEVLGIIGHNGAGKSTLLKVLSRVTGPTKGRIQAQGRMASLLEVGTGFHQEMTGRENIFMNGTIMGMTRQEIKSKLDEIVEFAGVARYLDTPVKRYSSGMTVRLGFAIAAHLEPEILVVDEVLAVGDAEFQKKCIGKLQDISERGRRTVLFVSHNLSSLLELCTRGIVLSKGGLVFDGPVRDAVDRYLSGGDNTAIYVRPESEPQTVEPFIRKIQVINQGGDVSTFFEFSDSVRVSIHLENLKRISANIFLGMAVRSGAGSKLFTSVHTIEDTNQAQFVVNIPSNTLLSGMYSIDISVFGDRQVFDYQSAVCYFTIADSESGLQRYADHSIGNLYVNCEWS